MRSEWNLTELHEEKITIIFLSKLFLKKVKSNLNLSSEGQITYPCYKFLNFLIDSSNSFIV